MKIEGAYTFHVPQDVVWPALLDPEVLARTLPGAQDLEQIGENEYKAKMKIRVGPVQGLFNGTVKLSNVKEMEGYHIQVDGKGAPGFVKGEGDLQLEASGDSTILNYSGDAQVGGRLASVGQRLMESSAQALIRQSLESLETQLEAIEQGADVSDLPPAEAPSQIEFAAGVTKKMLEDMVPAENRQDVIRTALAATGALFLLWMLMNWWTNRIANRVADIIEERR